MAASDKKLYELMFQVTAGVSSKLHSAFQTAMSTTNGLKDAVQDLNKTQSDIKSYQKTEEAVKRNQEEKARLESATDRNEAAIEKVNKKLAEEESKLSAVTDRLKAAGVDTNNLSGENDRLQKSYDNLIKAQNDYSKASAAVEKNKEAISATRKELFKTVGTAAAVGAAIYKGFVVPAADFQAEMSNIGAITGATVQELDAMAAGMRKIATATGTPLMDIASNAKMLAEAGGDVDLMMEQLTHGTNLANATQSDMATTLDFLGSQMKTFGIASEATQGVVDSFAYVSTLANLELSQLGEAFVNVGGSASAAGMSINDVNALMVTFSNAGLKGGAAGTSLNAVLRNLSTPTGKAAEALAELRIELYDQYGASRDMLEIMSDLENELGDMTDDLRNHYQSVIFDSVALKGWNMIVDEGVDSIYELRDELDGSIDAFDGAGQAAGMAAKQLDNQNGDIKRAKAAFSELAVTIGELFMPAARKGTQSVTEIIEKLTTFIKENKQTVIAVAKVVAGIFAARIAFLGIKLAIQQVTLVMNTIKAATAAYNLVKAIMTAQTKAGTLATLKAARAEKLSTGQLILGKAALIAKTAALKVATAATKIFNAVVKKNPIGLIITAVVALIALFMKLSGKNMTDFMEPLKAAFEKIKPVLDAVLEQFKEMGAKILPLLADAAQQIMPILSDIINAVLPVLISLVQSLLPIIMTLIDAALPILLSLVEALLPVIMTLATSAFTIFFDVLKMLLPLIVDLIKIALPVLLSLIEAILPVITMLVTTALTIFVDVLNMLLPLIMTLIEAVLPILLSLIEAILPVITTLVTSILPIFIEVIDMLLPPITTLIQAVLPVLMEILQALIPVVKFLAELFSKVLGAAMEGIKPIIDSVMTVFKGLIDFITGVFSGDWGKAWEGVKNIFKGIIDGLVGIIKLPLNVIIEGVNFFLGGLNELKIPDWVPLVGGKGFNIPLIPKLEKGSMNTPDTFIAGDVGGKGGELVTNAKGYKVFTAQQTTEIFENINRANIINKTVQSFESNKLKNIVQSSESSRINNSVNSINKIPGVNIELLNLLNIPRFEKGSSNTPDTFIAGDVGGKGGELVTNAKGYKVFTAQQTTEILNNINRINTLNNTIHPAANSSVNSEVQKLPAFGGIISAIKSAAANRVEEMSQKPLTALPAGRDSQQSIVLNYSPTIKVDGDVPGDLDEKIKQNNEVLIQMVLEALRKAREDERRNEYA